MTSIGITAMSWVSSTENDARPPPGLHQRLFIQRLQHDRGRGQREDHADCQRRLPGQAEEQRSGKNRRDGKPDLRAAVAQQFVAHVPEGTWLQLQPDQEQHHHDAEFGEMLQALGFVAHQSK